MLILKAIFMFTFSKPMIVCICKSVNDRQVASAIAAGACSVEQIARCTGAGTGCGTCRTSLRSALEQPPASVPLRKRMLPMAAPIAPPVWAGA